MADLKSGYKMMYEKDPIISPATVRDIKATKDTPLLTDKTVVFKEYESEATITRGTFYKVYEKLVDDSIRLYGVKRDDSVVEFAVYSGDDELLIGREKEVPPTPPVELPFYKHRLTVTVPVQEASNVPKWTQLAIDFYSTTDEVLPIGLPNKTNWVNVIENMVKIDSFTHNDTTDWPYACCMDFDGDVQSAEVVEAGICIKFRSDRNVLRWVIQNVISDEVI